MIKKNKDVLWLCILAMLEKEGKKHGYEIATILEKLFDVDETQVLLDLITLKSENMIEEIYAQENDGMLGACYGITSIGGTTFRELLYSWVSQKNKVEIFLFG